MYVIFLPKHVVVGKGKGHPITCPEGPKGQRHAPAAVATGKTIIYRIGVWLGPRDGLDECGFDPNSFQSVARLIATDLSRDTKSQ